MAFHAIKKMSIELRNQYKLSDESWQSLKNRPIGFSDKCKTNGDLFIESGLIFTIRDL